MNIRISDQYIEEQFDPFYSANQTKSACINIYCENHQIINIYNAKEKARLEKASLWMYDADYYLVWVLAHFMV